MTEPIRARPGELTADEVVDALDSGRRVLITVEVVGAEKEVALRRRGDVYYCDTPTTLHSHDTEEGIRACLEGQGYVSLEGSED
jgi:hypothetical protein